MFRAQMNQSDKYKEDMLFALCIGQHLHSCLILQFNVGCYKLFSLTSPSKGVKFLLLPLLLPLPFHHYHYLKHLILSVTGITQTFQWQPTQSRLAHQFTITTWYSRVIIPPPPTFLLQRTQSRLAHQFTNTDFLSRAGTWDRLYHRDDKRSKCQRK